MRYKNATINPKNINDRCFQYAFVLTQYQKEIKNYREHVPNIKPYLNLHNWTGKKYTTIKNSFTLFEKNNQNIALTFDE